MLFYQIVIFAIIQGLTEFLPVSSSGHLILYMQYLGWHDASNLMAVAVHLGTLGAVLVYFRQDVIKLIIGFFKMVRGKKTTMGTLSLGLIVGTLPAVVFGYTISHFELGPVLNTLPVIAWTVLLYGILLGLADRLNPQLYNLSTVTVRHAFMIGCAQALALIPGTSRSGICITMMRYLGFCREDAARFTFLLSIPAILGAGVLTFKKAWDQDITLHQFQDAGFAAVGAFIAGLAAISMMMRWLRVASYQPYVMYRIILGCILLYYAYGL